MLEQGHVLAGRYRIVRILGAGGMGQVYEAVHANTGRHVAIKVLRADDQARPETLARFEREARVSAQLETPHVVQVLDAGFDIESSQQFLVMELLRGQDLQRAIATLGPLPPERVARIGVQACLGLARAHATGIIHRDVKSANVFLAESGDDVVVKVLDFGIAKTAPTVTSTDPTLTRTGSVVGSPLYMSPEQAHGDAAIDARTDLWSLGVVLYEALAGKAPHARHVTFPRLVMAICHEPAPDLAVEAPWVDAGLARVIHRALQIEREARFASADEMAAALQGFTGGATALCTNDFARTEGAPARSVSIRPPLHPSNPFATTEMQGATSTTHASSLASSTAASPIATRSRRPALAAAVAVASLLALVAIVLMRSPSMPASSAPASTASASTAPASSALSDGAREVTVRVEPSFAIVSIDGVVTAVDAGFVRVRGSLGSVHHVVVTAGDVTVDREVVVSSTGAFPSSITLSPASAPAAPVTSTPGVRAGTDTARPNESTAADTHGGGSGARPRASTSSAPPALASSARKPPGRVDATEGFE